MATEELKSLLHQQIDRLDDPQDMQDLLLTVSEFVSLRTNQLAETPELVEQLARALSTISSVQFIAHSDVAQQAKQWISQ